MASANPLRAWTWAQRLWVTEGAGVKRCGARADGDGSGGTHGLSTGHAADEPRRGASSRFRLRHPQGRSEAEDLGGRSPEGLREAKPAIRLTGLRTEDVRDWARARGPVAAAWGS